jgi:hypothetical protein
VGQLVEVLAMAVDEVAPGGPLRGASIDWPQPGRRVAARAVEVGGWALGRAAAAGEVEALLDGTLVARAPVRRPRPDIAAAFPGVKGAASAGFELLVDAGRGPAEADLEVRARLGADAVPIGRLRLRRCWRDEPAPGETPLVSAVVVWEGGDGELERTLRSVAGQRADCWIEPLVVHPDEHGEPAPGAWREWGVRAVAAPEPGAAALRNEGIRRGNGQFVAFLEAGTVLADGALGRCLESLGRHPEAAGVVDTAEGGAVVAAVYRRSAFEELGGFEDGPEPWIDGRLSRRAAEYGALFEPGTLVAGDGS